MSWPTEGALVALDSIKALNAGISFISALTFSKSMMGEKFADLLFTAHNFPYILCCCRPIMNIAQKHLRPHLHSSRFSHHFRNTFVLAGPFVYMTTARWHSWNSKCSETVWDDAAVVLAVWTCNAEHGHITAHFTRALHGFSQIATCE